MGHAASAAGVGGKTGKRSGYGKWEELSGKGVCTPEEGLFTAQEVLAAQRGNVTPIRHWPRPSVFSLAWPFSFLLFPGSLI